MCTELKSLINDFELSTNPLRDNEFQKIKFIRICWVDLNNKTRCKAPSKSYILDKSNGFEYVTVTNSCMSFPTLTDMIVKNSLPSEDIGEIWLVPDWKTLVILDYLPDTAQVMAYFYQSKKGVIAPALSTSGGPQSRLSKYDQLVPFSLDPRNVLKRAMNDLQVNHGLQLKGSFEEEFYLFPLKPWLEEGMLKPLDSSAFASVYSLDTYNTVLSKITNALEAMNIPIEQILKESGPGQFEITIPYTDILVACDRHKLIHQTVKAVAYQNGFIACFLPKVFANSAGNGCHAHLSLWRDGKNIVPITSSTYSFYPESGFSQDSCRFVAGLLHHAKSLTAIFNPCNNSYRRLTPNSWSGGYIAWGVDNKEVFIRIPSSPSTSVIGNTNFEVKTIDHCSNPYLVMASIIYAGMHGMNDSSIQLPPLTSKNPANFTEEEKKQYLIGYLPSNLTDSLQCLDSDSYLKENLGHDIIKSFITVKKFDLESVKGLTLDDEIKKLIDIY
ncbi:glutamate-ammonia ligase [Tieghemostelium lacteum]|uniref:Glutamate-ammonia ligase n=1 Tax=Tieghemostelium lacteum TaxID=361077 RepID=A0A152A1H3_TIELA|nr:glutamate-ammonia ligase [Tieghemostelium lacteum]|eukprot:KYR00076.1 glutamate-ammonia ligase [Tieghemostelium lacteum]